MTKRILSAILVLAMVLCCCACGSNTAQAPSAAPTEAAVENTVAAAEAETPAEEPAPLAFPEKTIEITVPWAAGGIVDIVVRQLAQEVSQTLGQPMVVINQPGAAATLATTEFLQAEPDGYKLLVSSIPVVCFQPFIREITYSWDDFAPIVGLQEGKYFVMTSTKSGLNTLDDIKALGETKTILSGTGGVGTFDDIYGSALMNALGVPYENVPYDDSISIQNALLSGDIDVCLGSLGNFEEQVKAGNLQVLATYDAENYTIEGIGEISSLKSLGYDVSGIQQFFILGRAGTDPAVIECLNKAFTDAINSESFREFISGYNLIIDAKSPEAIDTLVTTTYDFAAGMLNG